MAIPCATCEYGQRALMGPLDAYTPPEDIVIICRCPQKVNGKCSCPPADAIMRHGGMA